jgi:hypothetical protein
MPDEARPPVGAGLHIHHTGRRGDSASTLASTTLSGWVTRPSEKGKSVFF